MRANSSTGLPSSVYQSVQNAAAWLVFRLLRSDHNHGCTHQPPLAASARKEKGLFSRSPCRLIGLSMAMPRSTYGSSRRYPVSTKTAVFFIWRSTRSCCQTVYYWTSRLPCRRRSRTERPTCRCHLSNIYAHLQKTTETASVSTFLPWPSFVH